MVIFVHILSSSDKMNLSKLTMPRINYLRENLNLTEDEEQVFDLLVKNKTIKEISDRVQISPRSVARRIAMIKRKMNDMED